SSFPTLTLWGPQFIQIYNDGFASLLGGRHPDAMGQQARVCWPEAWTLLAPACERVFAGETVALKDLAVPLLGFSGESLILSCSPIRDETGIVGIYVIAYEGVENRQAEVERVRVENDERYRQLSEAVPQIVWSCDAEGRIDYFNSRWFAYTGQRPGEDYTE